MIKSKLWKISTLDYDVIKCEKDFAVVKANATKEGKTIETFGSALKGAGFKDGNTNTWYVYRDGREKSLCILKQEVFKRRFYR